MYRTRGMYMFIAIAIAMVIKFYSEGITPLPFFIAGVIVAVITQIFRVYVASFLWGRQAVSQPEAEFLATVGPYAYVRNPMYLGNFIIGLSLCLAINEWYAYLLFTLSYIFVYLLVIPYEEKYLEEKFGKKYAEYKASTKRLVPKLGRCKEGTNVIPDYKAGILGEIHVPVFLATFFITIYLLFVRQ